MSIPGQSLWIAVFVLLGFAFAAFFVWFLYYILKSVLMMIRCCHPEDIRLHYSTNKNNSAREGSGSGLIGNHLVCSVP